ncbi:MAG: VOC family protein [Bacillota bacterium]
MGTRFDMIGLFVSDLPRMVAFYRDVLGFEIEWDGNGPYAEFKHEGIRFSMFERAGLPGLLGGDPGVSERPKRHLRAGHRSAAL